MAAPAGPTALEWLMQARVTHPPTHRGPIAPWHDGANTHTPTTDVDWETKCPQGAEERNPVATPNEHEH